MTQCHVCGSSKELALVLVRPLVTYEPKSGNWWEQTPMETSFYVCSEHSPLQALEAPQDPTGNIRTLAKEGKVVFASSEEVQLLEPFVDRIWAALHPGQRLGFTSDDEVVTAGCPHDPRRLFIEAAQTLGISLTEGERLVEAAARLARKEGALS